MSTFGHYVVANVLLLPAIAFIIYADLALVRARRMTTWRAIVLALLGLAFPVLAMTVVLNARALLGQFGAGSGGAVMAVSCVLCSFATALCLKWATGSTSVTRRVVIAGLVSGGMLLLSGIGGGGSASPAMAVVGPVLMLCAVVVWHALVATALSKWAYEAQAQLISCCAACGYDLRGIAGDVCPECGGQA